jgi:hypothetical protein
MAINFFNVSQKLLSRIKKTKPVYSFEMDDLELIKTYREFDRYKLDLEIYPKTKIHIPRKLPSEPTNGVTYVFEPSGYIGEINSTVCVVPVSWRNINNYCHWNFSEIPVLHLAFSSTAKIIWLAPAFLEANLPFQLRWIEILKKKYRIKLFNLL